MGDFLESQGECWLFDRQGGNKTDLKDEVAEGKFCVELCTRSIARTRSGLGSTFKC